jgi:hypothetical protein
MLTASQLLLMLFFEDVLKNDESLPAGDRRI